MVPAALANLNKTHLNSTSQSATSQTTKDYNSGVPTTTNSTNNMRRGNSISSLSHPASEHQHSANKRPKPESRGSTRAASSKGIADL